MSSLLAAALLAGVVAGNSGQTATPVADKLHPYLRQQLDLARNKEKLPVYFVMRDRLRYDDFASRIRGLDRESRRELVMGELRDHMAGTQDQLFTTLTDRATEVTIISRNWLGNFIRAEATPEAILAGAAVDAVEEVWYDFVPPRELVEDGPSAAAQPIGPVLRRGVGNGPRDTRAEEVWAAGVTGAGVVWMNADSGVRASSTNIGNVHPGLVGRLWKNPGEIFNNGIDDDSNGRVDDFRGWNFGANNANIDDGGGHGTQTAGVFVSFNASTSTELGNCPDTEIMTAALSGESSQWDAVQYAIEMGAHGQTSSHSYKNNFAPLPNYKMHRDVAETSMAAGLIRTNSTSNNGTSCNSGSSIGKPFNMSAPGCLPAPWIHPDQTMIGGIGGVMGIGAHNVGSAGPSQPSYTPCGPFAWDLDDLLAVAPTYPLANWSAAHNDYPYRGGSFQGLLKPDLTGPTGTRTSSGNNAFSFFSGTSNATPSVASCLALAFSANTSLTPEDMAMAAMTTAVDYGAPGKDNLSGAGKLDAWELTKMCRNLLRVDGDVAHTKQVSVSGQSSVTFTVDGVPNRNVFLIYGSGPANNTSGELTIRVQNPKLAVAATTDAQGNYSFVLPVQASWSGFEGWVQFVERDPDFGPLTGSNAVRIQFTP